VEDSEMRIFWGILLGGLIAGALDIIYAFVVYGPLSYGISPERVLQSVAAGWIGREASQAGGWSTASLGLGTHFLIASIMAAVYVLAARSFSALNKNPILWGLVYGLILYVAMNYIVVPLSAAGANGRFASSLSEMATRLQSAFSEVQGGAASYPWMLWGTIFTHTVLVGIPMAWVASRFARQSD
jgi:uncharacterized membrane protein YagU involved in acid resistance